MRPNSIALFAIGLLACAPAMAQDGWDISDPSCDPQILAGTIETVQEQQEMSAKDAKAVNDYYKKIKEGLSDDKGKFLSCVDVNWPDLPFSGMLPMVERFIKEAGDKAVAEACNKMRDQVRDAESLFNTDDLKAKVLGSLGDAGNYTGGLLDGNLPNIPGNPGGGLPPTRRPNPLQPPDEGGLGGLIDLIRPPGNKQPPPTSQPPGSGDPPPVR